MPSNDEHGRPFGPPGLGLTHHEAAVLLAGLGPPLAGVLKPVPNPPLGRPGPGFASDGDRAAALAHLVALDSNGADLHELTHSYSGRTDDHVPQAAPWEHHGAAAALDLAALSHGSDTANTESPVNADHHWFGLNHLSDIVGH